MTAWVKAGEIKYREDVRNGIENAGKVFVDMLKGGNKGKMVVKIK
jgi:NADPH-dependent curcumin reductase CurA